MAPTAAAPPRRVAPFPRASGRLPARARRLTDRRPNSRRRDRAGTRACTSFRSTPRWRSRRRCARRDATRRARGDPVAALEILRSFLYTGSRTTASAW
eukprot:29843-Pelagococcus_subviridis.AAC.3